MSIDSAFLSLLVCPETHQPLKHADAALLESLNARIGKGEVKYHGGRQVTDPLSEALVREDGKALYRVDDDLPNMLVDERIDL